MPNRFPLDQVDVALLALGRKSIPALFGEAIDVDGITKESFDQNGALVLRSPMVRIRFEQANYAPRDNQRTTYGASPQWLVLAYCENLRSTVDEKLDTLRLLDAVQECFAGARLSLANGHTTAPIRLGDVLPMMTDGQVIDGFFSTLLTIEDHAQFSGTNANFGGQHA